MHACVFTYRYNVLYMYIPAYTFPVYLHTEENIQLYYLWGRYIHTHIYCPYLYG